MPNLGLNEALLVISKGNVSGQIVVFGQDEECFGCPLAPLKALADEPDKYVVDSKHSVQLELRQITSNTTGSLCRLNEVALNSQGQYRIDVNQAADESVIKLDCKLKTLDYGECLLCPFAILICFLFAILAAEQAYTKFWLRRAGRRASEAKLNAETHEEATEVDPEAGVGVGEGEAKCAEGEQLGLNANRSVRRQLSVDQGTASIAFEAPEPELDRAQPVVLSSGRIECLDIFRGLTLAGMIFVNYGGAGYAVWDHKPWDGITLADFVFPFFIFSMGASIAISIRSMVKRHRKSFRTIAVKIIARSLILLLLGIFLNSKAVNYEQADGLARLRLTGVLQRFAISYLVIAFMYTIELTLNKWTRAQSLSNVPYLSKMIGVIFEILTAINYTTIYIYLTYYFDYDSTGNCPPGYTGPGGLTANGHYASCTGGSAAWLDRLILGESHLYQDHEVRQVFKTKVTHDPEGILGYATSIVLTLIGLQCGKVLTSKRTPSQKLVALAKWILVLAASCSLVLVIPINKRLWSLTFIIVTALAAFVIVMAFYILIDIYSCKRALLVRLLSSAGKNSIFLYVAHSLIYGMLPWWFPVGDQASHMQQLFRLTWATLVWLLIAHYMAHKKLFIKV